jgi:hypothetical protein
VVVAEETIVVYPTPQAARQMKQHVEQLQTVMQAQTQHYLMMPAPLILSAAVKIRATNLDLHLVL